MSGCGCEIEIKDQEQKAVLYWLLGINAVMFIIEMSVGFIADSTALIADSLDMLADAVVYGVGVYAVGKTIVHKANAAKISGCFQLALGLLILFDIVLRATFGSEPESILMMSMGCVALIANVICLVIIRKQKEGEVHMRASWIFSANDVIANIGVILAGSIVYLFDTRWPDLVIGFIVSIVVMRGAVLILKDARQELRENSSTNGETL